MSKEFIDHESASRTNAWNIYPEDLTVIGLDTDDGAEHPLYDPDVFTELDEASIANVATLGVLTPIAFDKDASGRLVVVDGRTRVRWAREVNKRRVELGEPRIKVPVFKDGVRKGKTHDESRWTSVQVSSNEIRKEKGVLWKAEKAKNMADRGIPKEDIATCYGVTTVQVDRWIVLGNASQAIRDAVKADKLSAEGAIKIAMMNPGLQKTALAKALGDAKTGKKTSTRDLDKLAGKTLPPSRKELKATVKRLSETATDAQGQLVLRVLEWAYKGGDLSEILSTVTAAPATETPAEVEPEADETVNPFDDGTALEKALLEHVLSPTRGTTVPNAHVAVTKFGLVVEMKEVSECLRDMLKRGLVAKPSPTGYKLPRPT